MKPPFTAVRTIVAASGTVALLALAACGEGERQPKADAPSSEAEVTRKLPETTAKEERLEGNARATAVAAASSTTGNTATRSGPNGKPRTPSSTGKDQDAKAAQGTTEPAPGEGRDEDNPMLGMRPL